MNDYFQKQEELFNNIEKRLKSGDQNISIVNPPENYEQDSRMCLTTLSFIPDNIQKKIYKKVIDPLRELDPSQYYYQPSSLHLTMCNVRVINDPPQFDAQTIEKAKQAFQNIAPKFPSFKVYVKGLFEFPYNLGVRVYMPEEFKDFVLAARRELKKLGAPDDKQYASNEVVGGNTTIVRYYKTPNDEFFQKVRELKEVEIGEFIVREFVLLSSNAVLAKDKTKILEPFYFK